MSRRIPPRVRPTVPPPAPLVSGTQPRVLRSPPRPFFTLPDDDLGRVDRPERTRPGRTSRSRSAGRARPVHPVQETQPPVRPRSGNLVRVVPPSGIRQWARHIWARILAGLILFGLGSTVLIPFFAVYRGRIAPGCDSPGLYLAAAHLGIQDICPPPDPLVAEITDFVAEQVASGQGITTNFVLEPAISSVELRASNTALRNFTKLAKPVRSNAEEDLILSRSEQWSNNPDYPDVQIYHSADLLDQAKSYHQHAKAVNAGIEFLSNDLDHLFAISDSSAAAKYSPSIDSDITQLQLDLSASLTEFQNLAAYTAANATTYMQVIYYHLLWNIMKRSEHQQTIPLGKTLKILKTFASTHEQLLSAKLAKSKELERDIDLAKESRTNFRETFQKAWKIWVRECTSVSNEQHVSGGFSTTTSPSSKSWGIVKEHSGYCAAFDPEPLRLASIKDESYWYLSTAGEFASAATSALEELHEHFANLLARVNAAIGWQPSARHGEFTAFLSALGEKVEERQELWRVIVRAD